MKLLQAEAGLLGSDTSTSYLLYSPGFSAMISERVDLGLSKISSTMQQHRR